MFATCYTNNESALSFDNAACETIRTTPKGRRCRVSRDLRTCEGLDEFWWGYTTECRDVPARAEFLVNHARTLPYRARVALREAARNSMRKLAAAVKPAAVKPAVEFVMTDAAAPQCGTGALPSRMEDHDGWWRSACVYMTAYGPENQGRRECSYHAESRRESRNAAHPERIPAPAITTEELAAMPTAKVEALAQLCRTRLDALHEAPVYWAGAQAWTELLTYANSELRYRRAAC